MLVNVFARINIIVSISITIFQIVRLCKKKKKKKKKVCVASWREYLQIDGISNENPCLLLIPDEVCKYKGKTYPMFDTWHTDDCEWCMCEGEYGYMCCSK